MADVYRTVTYRDETPVTANNRDPVTNAPVLSAKEARQGVVSGRVVAVLVLSLGIAVIAAVIMTALHYYPI